VLRRRQQLVRNPKKEYVLLLHGMGRTRFSMRKLESCLRGHGYETINIGYPSTSQPVACIAEDHLDRAVQCCREDKAGKIHFVTHSLGGIVVRQYLQTHSVPAGSRLVMLAPPNRGSEVAEFLKNFFLYRWLMGPAGQVIGTSPNSLPHRLKPVAIEVGVIAGDRSINPLFSLLMKSSNDGAVSVESARLLEMKDFLVVPSNHTFIMRNPVVLRQVVHFLEQGKFSNDRI
jgi:triacylglycerol lipase